MLAAPADCGDSLGVGFQIRGWNGIIEALLDFWNPNGNSAHLAILWDAFKAHTKGQYQTLMGKPRCAVRADLERAAALEVLYTQLQDPSIYTHLQDAQDEVLLLHTVFTKKHSLY